MATAIDLAADMEKLIGGNDEASTVKTWLDTGFAPLNYALSNRWDGGIPVGRITEIYGPESSGKTAITTRVMASAQKMGGIAGFMDHERSFSMILAPRLGLDVSAGRFIYKKPRTFEESLDLCIKVALHVRKNKLIHQNAPIAWAFDSLAAMVPGSKLTDAKGKDRELGSYNMHDSLALAKATSSALPAFAQMVDELQIAAIFLNQMREKPGVTFGDPNTTPGGKAPKFYASIRMQLGASRISKGEAETAEVIGAQISARMIKNKVSRPFRKATWRFVFQEDGTGKFDVTRSMVDFLVKEGKIAAGSKGYVVWDGKNYFPQALADKIEKEGRFAELTALLPAEYEPPVMAAIEIAALETEPEAETA